MATITTMTRLRMLRLEQALRDKVHTRTAKEHAFQLNHMCSDKRHSGWEFA